MSDTFDPIAFLSAVSGDGDWSDEFLEWYEPGKWLSDERACAAFIAEKFVQLQADRDSWYQQHSDRVDDAVRFASERDAALAECTLLRDHAAGKITDATLMTGLNVTNGGIDFGLQGGAAQLLAEGFAKQFKDDGGVNYVEYRFESQEVMPGVSFVVSLQRVEGLTPSQKLAASEAECAGLRSFAQAIMGEWPDVGGLDGLELQMLGEEHGLLTQETRYAPCCEEGCRCADDVDETDWKAGVKCYRKTPLLKGGEK